MSDDDVFGRRWVLTEDQLLRMLWRSYAGENPDVLLLELYAERREDRRDGREGTRARRPARHLNRHRVVR